MESLLVGPGCIREEHPNIAFTHPHAMHFKAEFSFIIDRVRVVIRTATGYYRDKWIQLSDFSFDTKLNRRYNGHNCKIFNIPFFCFITVPVGAFRNKNKWNKL